ncbi:hypothetical protein [Aeoliella sp.]|uniref:hypothetical protein n=1 Tax=Aeoliella sp. TaxID=2795800 RepID=UPI003CCBCF74
MAGKFTRIMYVELKSGYSDNGPAWITRVRFSRTMATAYFRDRVLKRGGGQLIQGNFYDEESGEEYWVSGPKKSAPDRHWAGGGLVSVDPDVAEDYWREVRGCEPPPNPLVA